MQKYFFYSLIIFSLTACDIINPEEEIPAYIHIEKFDLKNVNQATQGSSSENIRDAYVIINNVIINVVELPATIPILERGITEITFEPGIRRDGISSDLLIYPFYTRSPVYQVDLVPGQVDTIRPETSYEDNVDIELVANFEGGNFFSNIDGFSANNIEAVNAGFEGLSGKVTIDTTNFLFEAASLEFYPEEEIFDIRGVFLEFDFKGDISFGVDIFSHTLPCDEVLVGERLTDYDLRFNAKDEWTKAYVDVTDAISNANADCYRVAFASDLYWSKNIDLGAVTRGEGTFYLDNIKIVHFQ